MPTSPDRGDWGLGRTVESDAPIVATANAVRSLGQGGRLAQANLYPSTDPYSFGERYANNLQLRPQTPLLAPHRRASTGRAESSRGF